MAEAMPSDANMRRDPPRDSGIVRAEIERQLTRARPGPPALNLKRVWLRRRGVATYVKLGGTLVGLGWVLRLGDDCGEE
jgi:hypothetical protein